MLNIPLEVNYTDTKEALQVIIRIKVTDTTMWLIGTWLLNVPAKFYTKFPQSCKPLNLDIRCKEKKHLVLGHGVHLQ